ncbi:AAA family ATPase [Pseudocolwellia agarivorans]|uniref:AAA family ATPase n=1 Tax=Pseudocolwellia agarivorans TaxID=1911682 RepID=UPI003F885344
MIKTLIFGNSGSGKSTLAKMLSEQNNLAHLDLDSIAWQPLTPEQSVPTRMPLTESESLIKSFLAQNSSWVIEGCYSDLLALLLDKAQEVIFLNLSVDDCIVNAKNRAWEPHKYESEEAQNANLDMLINWISEYPNRDDHFSQKSHLALFNRFSGKKEMRTSNK